MKLGIVIYSSDSETVWNAFRLGVLAQKKGDEVRVFLLAKGVECESLNTESFNVTSQMQEYINSGGHIHACGTCLKLRYSDGSEMCPISTMQDLYEIIKNSDKVVSF